MKSVNGKRSRIVATGPIVRFAGFRLPSIPRCRAPALRIAVAVAIFCVLLAPTQAPAQQPAEAQAAVPVADFFRTPRLNHPKLSASGRYLAGAMAVDGGRVNLAVLDL